MEKTYKITLAYDGTRYHGWEKKRGFDTIQGKVESVLTRLCEQAVKVEGAGRTDAGVHARGIVCSVRLDTMQSADQLCTALNRYLPDGIAVLEVREASPRFHARLKAEQMPDILSAERRSAAGPTAPAQGLCLMQVDY